MNILTIVNTSILAVLLVVSVYILYREYKMRETIESLDCFPIVTSPTPGSKG